jgi:intracellular septation protein A
MLRQRSPFLRLVLINWLPRLLVVTVLPLLIYQIASPHLSQVDALLLAASPSALLTVFWLLVRRKLTILGMFSLGIIAFKLVDGLVLRNATLLLLLDPMLMGGLAVLLLGSLLVRRPLLLALATSLAAQLQQGSWQSRLRKQGAFSRSMLIFLTGLAGVTLLLQSVVHTALVLLFPVGAFGLAPLLLLKRLTTYGLFGMAGLVLLGYLAVQRRRSHHQTHEFLSTQPLSDELLHR